MISRSELDVVGGIGKTSLPWCVSSDWLLISLSHDNTRQQREYHPEEDEAPEATVDGHSSGNQPQPEQTHEEVRLVVPLLPLEEHELGNDETDDEDQQHL